MLSFLRISFNNVAIQICLAVNKLHSKRKLIINDTISLNHHCSSFKFQRKKVRPGDSNRALFLIVICVQNSK